MKTLAAVIRLLVLAIVIAAPAIQPSSANAWYDNDGSWYDDDDWWDYDWWDDDDDWWANQTPTKTPTKTPTRSGSLTNTPTKTPTGTLTPTKTPTKTFTSGGSTGTTTPTKTPTKTFTNSPSTSTNTPTKTATNTPTNTSTATNTKTATNTPNNTSTPTSTKTATKTPTNTPTNTNTPTDTPTNTPTNTDTPTNTPTNTDTPTNTPTNTDTPTNTPTDTDTPTETPTPTPTQTSTPTCAVGCIDFELIAPSVGTISYAGGAAPLIGLGIDVDSIIGVTTPVNNGVELTCFGCVLTFTTGGSTGSTANTWNFGPGGFITLIGGVDMNGNDIQDGGDIPAGSVLFSGPFVGTTLVQRFTGSFRLLAGAFEDTKDPALLAYFGLSNVLLDGAINLSFNATGVPPNAFTSSSIFSGNATNCVSTCE